MNHITSKHFISLRIKKLGYGRVDRTSEVTVGSEGRVNRVKEHILRVIGT